VTINIAISVNEGLVMAADSLSQVSAGKVYSIHQSVEKITEIRARPIAVMINGLGEIAKRTIISLIREFEFFQHQKPRAPIRTWSVVEMASQLKVFIGNKYVEAYGSDQDPPDLGVIVGGYSPDSFFPELYEIDFAKNSLRAVVPSKPGIPTGEECIEYWGKRSAIDRLYLGVDKGAISGALTVLNFWQRSLDLGVDPRELPPEEFTALMEEVRNTQSPECVNDFDTTGVRIIYAATSGRLM
jgi:hypothetical protein